MILDILNLRWVFWLYRWNGKWATGYTDPDFREVKVGNTNLSVFGHRIGWAEQGREWEKKNYDAWALEFSNIWKSREGETSEGAMSKRRGKLKSGPVVAEWSTVTRAAKRDK